MPSAIVRFGRGQWTDLCSLLFSRYPHHEWATWVRFGWRRAGDEFVFTMVALDPPRAGELDDRVGHVAIQEAYSLRVALESEHHPFAVGVVHSHPQGYKPIASPIDDDMDGYYGEYLDGFTSGRPYLSLIVSEMDGELVASGRFYVEGKWHPVVRFVCEGLRVQTFLGYTLTPDKPVDHDRIARLDAQFGKRAAQRIRNACVAVVGASGTGSPAIEVLARAGVGHIVVVDPDVLDKSNLERVHGAYEEQAAAKLTKVEVAREHVTAIDSDIRFDGYVGRVPQPEVVDALALADAVIACTDQQHSRLALSEIAFRYLVPVIDCGVSLEGANGTITGQTIQLVNFETDGPCAVCRGMIDWNRISQELMTLEERERRRQAARVAREQGADPGGYWKDLPQINTVGYLTTSAGALAAGSVLGIISGAFRPGYARAQLNLLSEPIHAIDWPQQQRESCCCRTHRGYGDLGAADRLITPPSHWPAVRVLAMKTRS